MTVKKATEIFLKYSLFCIFFLFFLHLFGKWSVSNEVPEPQSDTAFFGNKPKSSSIVLVSKIFNCDNECLLFNQVHHTIAFRDEDVYFVNFRLSHFRFVSSLEFSLIGHLWFILLVGSLGIVISSLRKRRKKES